jgi:hypothetical protein
MGAGMVRDPIEEWGFDVDIHLLSARAGAVIGTTKIIHNNF